MAFGDHIQSADFYGGPGTTATTASVTFANPVGVGNFVVVTCGGFVNEVDIAFSDNKGNTYIPSDPVTYVNGYFTKLAYCINITNGPTTFTATYTTGARNFQVLSADEFSGTPSTWMEQSSRVLHQNSTTVTTGNIVTLNTGDLLFAVTDNTTFTTITGPGGIWTERQPGPFHAVMYGMQAAPGSVSGTFTFAATSGDAWAAIFAFASGLVPVLMGEQCA